MKIKPFSKCENRLVRTCLVVFTGDDENWLVRTGQHCEQPAKVVGKQ
jgi:hypothetical protein